MERLIKAESKSRKRKGLAAVELALLLPLLMIILLGVIEYGWLFFAFHVTGSAAREGCRIGVTKDATAAQVQEAIDSRMAAGGFTTGYTWNNPVNPFGFPAGSDYRVAVELDYDSITSFPLIPVPSALRREVVMRKEGPLFPSAP